METTAAAVAEVYAMEKPGMSDEEWRKFEPSLYRAMNALWRKVIERCEVREKGDG
jgi:hypothetical protein